MFPVRMIFGEGDCLCAERAFHNLDADSVRRKRISRHGSFGAVARCADSFCWRAGKGLLKADHTVAVLKEVSYMVFDQPRHIAMLEKAYEHNLAEKIELLSSVPNYTRHPRASIEKMARHCRRVWYGPGNQIMREGDRADTVFYVVHGQVSVVKGYGTEREKTLNVMGRGSCIGDWGVVNDKPRLCAVSLKLVLLRPSS